jgi:hypothetical protein
MPRSVSSLSYRRAHSFSVEELLQLAGWHSRRFPDGKERARASEWLICSARWAQGQQCGEVRRRQCGEVDAGAMFIRARQHDATCHGAAAR